MDNAPFYSGHGAGQPRKLIFVLFFSFNIICTILGGMPKRYKSSSQLPLAVTFDSSAGAWQIGLGVDQQIGLGVDLFLVVTVAARSLANVLKVVLPTQLPLSF